MHPLKKHFSILIQRRLALAVALLILADWFFQYRNFKSLLQNQFHTVSVLFEVSVREPLVQGSELEVNKRIQTLIGEGIILNACFEGENISFLRCLNAQDGSTWNVRGLTGAINFGGPTGELLTRYRLEVNVRPLVSSFLVRCASDGLAAILIFLFLAFLVRRFARVLIAELQAVADNFSKRNVAKEYKHSVSEFAALQSEIELISKEKEKQHAMVAVAGIASKVAHDIRSPLSALEIAIHVERGSFDEMRTLLQGAVSRIRGILDQLIQESRKLDIKAQDFSKANMLKNSDCVDVIPIIREMIAEKSLLNGERIKVGLKILRTDFEFMVTLEKSEFQQILSNLIDNAVEGIEAEGSIQLSLDVEAEQILLLVTDNGRGIAPEILPHLMTKGASYGKATGTGLGLWFAKEKIQQWGGQIRLQSKLGQGTTVQIWLPRAKT